MEEDIFEEDFIGHAMAKVNDKVLAFGGRLCAEWDMDYRYTDAVHEYDILGNEWKTLPLTIEALQGMGCTPILNGEYILVIGGDAVIDGEGWSSGDIRIYSVREQTIKISGIQCPESVTACHAVAVRDKKKEILTAHGYIRENWKECGIADHLFPPEHILKLIAAWYWCEYVHIVNADHDGEGEHYKIDAFDILSL